MKDLEQYTFDMMIAAYKTLTENHMKVDRAAVMFAVPRQTFRDSVLNKVNIKVKWGKDSFHSGSGDQENIDN
ncbi:hypothetical protein DPMN_011817 [Dreissena polymorpha]|uniref:Uncharacterized protein n=1 Tax=Dreissena polymorpha TaxID=45954 RepID=A0A9D4N2C2_DREPO|nr:hypothetical protein DPMN_011817 [Dreissena polymorpha]